VGLLLLTKVDVVVAVVVAVVDVVGGGWGDGLAYWGWT